MSNCVVLDTTDKAMQMTQEPKAQKPRLRGD